MWSAPVKKKLVILWALTYANLFGAVMLAARFERVWIFLVGLVIVFASIFADLRLWQDVDHDGVSQPWELHALAELGVAGISLAYVEARQADENGNSFRYRAAVYGTPGSPVGMTAWDVWLVGVRPEPAMRSEVGADGNPRALKRCLKAAAGTDEDWLAYCRTMQTSSDREACFSRGNPSERDERPNWCYRRWGSVVTCDQ